MIGYKDPIPPVRKLLDDYMEPRIYGNTFPTTTTLPAVLVKSAGGVNFSRIQLVARATNDLDAMQLCIQCMNLLLQRFDEIRGLRVIWMEAESNPIPSFDDDTGRPEAWCYLRMENIEA
ncbi:hypothetical protein [Fictibacillus sp. NRS-1165]|uniref:hypothetical protein n=1 Tax=Fictibacillus sp. NRS-1165 TaxID=3144463 RepID=UPI003D1A3836